MRVALIANPTSGGGLDPDSLARELEAGGRNEVTVFGPEPPKLERVPASRPERLVVASGDGTLGSVAALAGRLDVPLGIIPSGTANDFARANELPRDPLEAARLAATSRATKRLELGRLAGGRPFVNVASAGLASVAARRAQPLKPRLGPLAYAVGALRAGATAQPLRCSVRADGRRVFAGDAWQAIVAVSGAFGGGAAVGASDPDDGRLDVVVVPAGSRHGLVVRAWGLRTHRIAEQRGVVHDRGTVIEVGLPPGTEFNVDGEVRDQGMERITVEPDAFALVVPGEEG
jgi:diacylglycerol kinase family enzyme